MAKVLSNCIYRLSSNNQDIYIGQWQRGKREGLGAHKYSSGPLASFKGEWREDNYSGVGQLV